MDWIYQLIQSTVWFNWIVKIIIVSIGLSNWSINWFTGKRYYRNIKAIDWSNYQVELIRSTIIIDSVGYYKNNNYKFCVYPFLYVCIPGGILFVESTGFEGEKVRLEIRVKRREFVLALLAFHPIVIKPEMRLIRPRSRVPGYTGWSGSTRINSEKFKNIFEILIFHMKKIKKQSMWI